ncbi:MAG: nucleotidyltransferase domain-containing protein [Chloroflexi bacterium]|nr:nucleotidyltransferase domain-containing protein [Chloroflexota bacterium]
MSKEKLKKSIRLALAADPRQKDILKVSLFGSYAYGKPKADSDVDILIEFRDSARIGLFEFVGMQRRLSERINKKVDLLTPDSISKYIKNFIINNAEIIYERR